MTSYEILPEKLADSISNWKDKKGSLIMILHDVQDFYGYVPKNLCFTLAKTLKIPLARIYEVLTFYNYFRLKKPAKNKISICMGTACYLKGAPLLLETIKEQLKINEGQITADGQFGLENVRCVGCCGLSPVVAVNGKIYGKLDKVKILNILNEYKKEG
ncbi:MAG: NAD(P)H-dependent oxidoreductase subunit E [bacterium]